ncbi:NAD(P)/FAD-dependent oxidoreductase, partial [Geodermatophilus maliterrae]
MTPSTPTPTPPTPVTDVVVVGGSIAGCTVATLLGRAGLRVLVLESHRDMDTYKRLCTHFIQSSATPTIHRLGLDEPLAAAGAVPNDIDLHIEEGWIRHTSPRPGLPPHGYSVRRSVLDPLLRRRTAATPGVEVAMGARVRDLLREDGRVAGVRADVDGEPVEVRARLVVGADGRDSRTASLAGLPGRQQPNARFAYFAPYRGVGLAEPGVSRMWLRPSGEASYVFPNDDGVTVLATFQPKERLAGFRARPLEDSLRSVFSGLPGVPELAGAERVGDVIGTVDYPNVTRRRVTGPGVALVGDAALVGDPLWGVGCGWAFQTGEWLADAVAPELLDGQVPVRGLAAYDREHRRRLLPHQRILVDLSSGRPLNRFERLVFGGAVHDERVARTVGAFGTRNAPPTVLFSPVLLARAARARRGARRPVPAGVRAS